MTDETHARPFADFLREQSRAHDELTEGLHHVLQMVEETGKAGTVTLTVKVEPDKKVAGIYRISDDVKVKAPEHDRAGRIYYKDGAGNLSRSDPNQLEFEGLRDVSAKAEPVTLKDVK